MLDPVWSMYKYKYNDFYSDSISQQYWDSMALWTKNFPKDSDWFCFTYFNRQFSTSAVRQPRMMNGSNFNFNFSGNLLWWPLVNLFMHRKSPDHLKVSLKKYIWGGGYRWAQGLFIFDRGPWSNNFVLSDLSVCWRFSKCNKSLRYESVPMNSALYVRRFSLNLIHNLIYQVTNTVIWAGA